MRYNQVVFDRSKDDQPLVACSRCKSDTKHLVLTSVDGEGKDPMAPGDYFYWTDTFQIIQCRGCETISLRKLHMNSEDVIQVGPDGWDYQETEELYPHGAGSRAPISDQDLLPLSVRGIYSETIRALNDGQAILTGIGVRAIVETVCQEESAKGKLSVKIDELVSKGVLTEEGADILHKLRVLGNRAAHEVKPHDTVQLNLALDVVDHLLMGVYILPHHARKTFK